jgi:hypothetical protein
VSERVDAAFVYTFARYDLPHCRDPRRELDRASPGIVKVLDALSDAEHPRYPGMQWAPKAAFAALADQASRLDWNDRLIARGAEEQ